jgi:hypothetical protein
MTVKFTATIDLDFIDGETSRSKIRAGSYVRVDPVCTPQIASIMGTTSRQTGCRKQPG